MGVRFWVKKAAPFDVLEARLRQASGVLATAQGESLVLLDLERERYFTLNDVGSRVWMLLTDGATRREIAEIVRNEFQMPAGVTNDVVTQDVGRLLTELHVAGLVVADTMPVPGVR